MNTHNKKRVLVAVGAFPPAHGGGGLRAARTYQWLAEKLPIDVHVISMEGVDAPAGLSDWQDMPVWRTQNIPSLKTQLPAVGRFFLQQGWRPFDLVHIFGISPVCNATTLWARLFRIPLLYEMCVLTKFEEFPKLLSTRFLFNAIRNAKMHVAISDGIQDEFIKLGVKQESIWLRSNPVSVDLFKLPNEYERDNARRRLGVSQHEYLHLVLGRFQERKNQLLAVKALERLPENHRLILAGPVYDNNREYLDSVQEQVKNSGLSKRVIMRVEFIKDVVSLYHAADCCWLPSLSEGLPNVILESLCCGVPVIINQSLGMNRHIIDMKNGINVALTPETFAEAVLQIEDLLKKRSRRKIIALEAMEQYDSKKINADFAQRLSTLLNLDL